MARLLAAKERSGKSFSQIAGELGLTNVFTTQLFYHQQQLRPETAQKLRQAVPGLQEADLEEMMRAPRRAFDPNILQVRRRRPGVAWPALDCLGLGCLACPARRGLPVWPGTLWRGQPPAGTATCSRPGASVLPAPPAAAPRRAAPLSGAGGVPAVRGHHARGRGAQGADQRGVWRRHHERYWVLRHSGQGARGLRGSAARLHAAGSRTAAQQLLRRLLGLRAAAAAGPAGLPSSRAARTHVRG